MPHKASASSRADLRRAAPARDLGTGQPAPLAPMAQGHSLARMTILPAPRGLVQAALTLIVVLGVSLPDGEPAKATVRWVRGDRTGLEFDGFSLEIGRTPAGGFAFRRLTEAKRKIADRAPRKTLVWTATVHADAEMAPAKLRNISATGAQLDCPLQLAPDTKVTLSLGGAGFMPSTVRWCEGGRMGLVFARHFDVEMLNMCADQDASMRAIEWVKPEYLNADSPWAARQGDKFTIADLP